MREMIVCGVMKSYAVVPDFDEDDNPDLSGWDDDIDEDDGDAEEIWAVFRCDDAAEICKPMLEKQFHNCAKIEKEDPTCDELSFIWEKRGIENIEQ